MSVKVCTSCQEVKDDSEFVYNRLKCKKCYRKEANERYQRSKNQQKEKKDPTTTRTHKENEVLKAKIVELIKENEELKKSVVDWENKYNYMELQSRLNSSHNNKKYNEIIKSLEDEIIRSDNLIEVLSS